MNIHIPPGRDGLDLTQRNGRRFRGGNPIVPFFNVRYWDKATDAGTTECPLLAHSGHP